MSTEIFKEIPGFTGYRVSNFGRVQSCRTRHGLSEKWRDIKVKIGHDGRVSIGMYDESGKQRCRRIATLVLTVFVGPRPKGMEACHDPDPCPRNNHLGNLRWGTKSDNMQDSIRHGTFPMGVKHHSSKLDPEKVKQIRVRASQGEKLTALAREFSVDPTTIRDIVRRRKWKHISD